MWDLLALSLSAFNITCETHTTGSYWCSYAKYTFTHATLKGWEAWKGYDDTVKLGWEQWVGCVWSTGGTIKVVIPS